MVQNHNKPKRMAGKYVEAFSWHASIDSFLSDKIKETPLLHVCSGPTSTFGDLRMDKFVQPTRPGVIGDWVSLPFTDNSFGAVFADPPWFASFMKQCADFCKEALRVAPVVYVMSPWLWCHKMAKRSHIWVREFPGVNQPVLFVRYEKIMNNQSSAPSIGDMIAKHQEIKAALEAAQEAFDAEWKPFKDGLRALENACGVILQEQKMQNFKADGSGTAYLRRGVKATVDNRDEFLAFIVKHNKWDFLDAGVLVDPVKDFLANEAAKVEHDPTYVPAAAPPGIKVEPYVACSIRKG